MEAKREMATTQLFVELLVIGIGVTGWIVLFVAAVFRWPLSPHAANLDAGALLGATAMAYILGIIMDRFSRALWDVCLSRPKYIHGTLTDEAERVIRSKSERLWNACVYNRSRFRICRAWSLNFLLLAICYAVWNERVHAHPCEYSTTIILIGLVLGALAAWATVCLNRDYYIEIEGILPLVS
jgi:hypothetical protein